MGKIKTSKKQKSSFGNDFPFVKLKKGVKTSEWHATKELLYEEELAKDKVIQHICKISGSFQSAQKIFLFGSRARKIENTHSDYDIAVQWKVTDGESWGDFAETLREKNPTLFSLDIVDLNKTGTDFHQKILQEGMVIYEKVRTK